jgi:hypothetical protein
LFRFAEVAVLECPCRSGLSRICVDLEAVLTESAFEELEGGGTVAAEDVLAAEMLARAESTNLSFFAFTATPNAKTLELFGDEGISGTPPDEHLPEGADHRRALPRERGLAHLQPVCHGI